MSGEEFNHSLSGSTAGERSTHHRLCEWQCITALIILKGRSIFIKYSKTVFPMKFISDYYTQGENILNRYFFYFLPYRVRHIKICRKINSNPLTPRRSQVSPFTEISINSILRSDHKKNSYERRTYESVDEKSLS